MEWNNTKTHLVLRAGVNLGGIKRRDVSKLRSVLVVANFQGSWVCLSVLVQN